MSTEADVAVLMRRVDELDKDLRAERLELKAVREKLDATEKKISTAETVGRFVIYALLGASAFLTQAQSVLKWIRQG